MKDNQGRKIDYLRISLTDRCNLRCRYCMPAEGIPLMEHQEILSYEEILEVVKAMAKLGVEKVRLTGGEPLLRKNICYLIKEIKKIEGIKDVAITTNGFLLDAMLEDLIEAGLDRVNLSLDTMDEETFYKITRYKGFDKVKRGLIRALEKGIKVKINVVPLKGYNDEELVELACLTQKYDMDVRFIELMPIGCGKDFESIPNEAILHKIKEEGIGLEPLSKDYGNGPAVHYKLEGGKGAVGFISALSHQFCSQCNRVRLTAEGFLKLCLHSKEGIDLKKCLRQGSHDGELVNVIEEAIRVKPTQHYFNQENKNEDQRSMNQIGG